MIEFVSAGDLAQKFGFAGPHDGFRSFCRQLGIQPIRRTRTSLIRSTFERALMLLRGWSGRTKAATKNVISLS
jgi:hypothetical protein